jgi:hypothetical protein
MLATTRGGSEPTPNDQRRREVLALLAAVGPHLLAASTAIDTPTPDDAIPELRAAAAILRPYMT